VTIARTQDLVDAAVDRGSAVPAFNVISLEHAEAIVSGAETAHSGVLLQVSENAIRYHGNRFEPLLSACRELAEAASTPVGIHLDHIEDPGLIDRLLVDPARLGIGSIMVDASTLSYSDNVAATASVVARARDLGLWVEAELGEIGGKDGAHAPGVRTNPSEALAFVLATDVDGLAVAVGSSHAMTARSASLDLELITELATTLSVPLVLHGSSGVPDATLALAIRAGIRKVNIGTALNVAATAAIRSALEAQPTATDPRRYTAASRDAMIEVVAHFCGLIAGEVSPQPIPRKRAAFSR
jgi:fructose-bisphosphate aldolase class II